MIKNILKLTIVASLIVFATLVVMAIALYIWAMAAAFIWTEHGDRAFIIYLLGSAFAVLVLLVWTWN